MTPFDWILVVLATLLLIFQLHGITKIPSVAYKMGIVTGQWKLLIPVVLYLFVAYRIWG